MTEEIEKTTKEKKPAGSATEAGGEPEGRSEDSEPTRARSEKEFDVNIFRAWCKNCGICVAFCPRKCIEQDQDGISRVTHPELCIGCGWCEIHCPDFAISVRPKKSKAAQEM